MDSGYDDCDWSVGNDMSWLRQPRHAIQCPIQLHEEYDEADSWAELMLMQGDYPPGNCSNMLSKSVDRELLPEDNASYCNPDHPTSSPNPAVSEEIPSPVTATATATATTYFEPGPFGHGFNLESLHGLRTNPQAIFIPADDESSGLESNYNCNRDCDCDCSVYAPAKKIEKSNAHRSPDHLWRRRAHAQTLLASFAGPNRCPWAGCTSRAKFAGPKLLHAHLSNIHVEPLICGVRGCGYQKPFRNKHDLERHTRTAHVRVMAFAYPYPRCGGQGLRFARKDKLLLHFRDVHGDGGGDVCPLLHCWGMLGGEGGGTYEEGSWKLGMCVGELW
ncbi:hypothetical protein DSL72_004941 [Monilinia vaccinii-corymbosi]|uniref:C2H2-type domain-containing protein n=1 Tax=Monilinia vaccinii-corymbosi TaxID=61207 RepID=A0A8A3P836_9HELO|nr:hypothetical protein DSL72_004941 [Monilinia vaccinii-corymbosi]